MKAFFPLYLASVKEFLRDRMALFWTLAFPLLFIVLFGIIFSGSGNITFTVGVAVQDKGPVGSAMSNAFKSVNAFVVTEGTQSDLLAKFKNGDLQVVVVVPDGVSSSASAGKASQVQVYYDPTNQTTSQVVLTIVRQVVEGFDRQLSQRPTLFTVQAQPITSASLRTIDFLLPGILAMSLMQLGLFATAPALVQLREQQVLRRIGATPLPRTTLLGAQVTHRLTIGVLQTFIIIVAGVLLFNVHMGGNWLVLLAVVLLGALMFVAMGYFISGLAKSQESVTGISQMINFPMMFLSGVFIPIAVMPAWIRPIVSILPLTYLADALRQIMVQAPPAYSMGFDLLMLAVWMVVCGVLAVRLFRWE